MSLQTRSGVRLGMSIPQVFADGAIDMALVRDYIVRAEAFGFDDLWVTEQITGTVAALEPLTLLTYAAALTTRARLGVSVLVSNLRNPVQLAKELSSLDQVSGGRLIAGLGLGTNTRAYPAFGIGEERRVARFVDGLRVMRALWTEPRVTLEAGDWRLAGVPMEPKPVQTHLPVWFGARAPDALRRTARLADGWMGAGSSSVDHDFGHEIAMLRGYLREQGRDEATFPMSKRVFISVNDDRARARDGLVPYMKGFYGNEEFADRWGVYGSVDECAERLGMLVEAGANHLLLNPVDNDLAQLEVIATKLAPRL